MVSLLNKSNETSCKGAPTIKNATHVVVALPSNNNSNTAPLAMATSSAVMLPAAIRVRSPRGAILSNRLAKNIAFLFMATVYTFWRRPSTSFGAERKSVVVTNTYIACESKQRRSRRATAPRIRWRTWPTKCLPRRR